MGKREKVLIALMIIAIGYGAFEFLYEPSTKAPVVTKGVNLDEVAQLSTTVSQSVQKADLEEKERFILEAAAAPWARNPFYVWPPPREEDMIPEEDRLTEEAMELRQAITYSGYLEMGAKRMAVINGMEYQVGEMLQGREFIVMAITPDEVTLLSKRSDQEIKIPYEDEFFVD
jgi:hypothetical protein